MTNKIERKFVGPGLQPVVVADKTMTVIRAPRRAITGIAFNAQRSRLILDAPDSAGNESYPCKIANVSDAGFGLMCPAAAKVPDLFKVGAHMTLEGSDGKRSRVEVRWISNGRLGLRLVGAKPR